MRRAFQLAALLAAIVIGGAASAAPSTAAAQRIIDDTFAEPASVARALTSLLAQTPLPAQIRTAADDLVRAGLQNLAGARPLYHGKMTGGDDVADVEAEDGRSTKLDSRRSGFIALFANDRFGHTSDWGELYVFGDADDRLSSVVYSRMVTDPISGERAVRAFEAYAVPGKVRHSWIVFDQRLPLPPSGQSRNSNAGDPRDRLRAAGFDLLDTGFRRALLPMRPDRLRGAMATLVSGAKDVRVIGARQFPPARASGDERTALIKVRSGRRPSVGRRPPRPTTRR